MGIRKQAAWFVAAALVAAFAVDNGLAKPPRSISRVQTNAALKDPTNGAAFDETFIIDGQTFHCLGAGGHKVLFYEVYSNAFCVDAKTSLETIQEYILKTYPDYSSEKLFNKLKDDDKFFDLLSKLPGDKLIQIRFLRDLSRDQIADAMVKATKPLVPAAEVERVNAAFRRRDPRQGDLALIFSQGEALNMHLADSRERFERANALVDRIWLVWLGGDSPTPSLREELARRFGAQNAGL